MCLKALTCASYQLWNGDVSHVWLPVTRRPTTGLKSATADWVEYQKEKHTDKIRVLLFVHSDSSRKRSQTLEFTPRSVSKEALRQNKKVPASKIPLLFPLSFPDSRKDK